MSSQPRDAKSIFLEAVENHSPADWPAFLSQQCGSDLALRLEVEALLDAHSQHDSLLDADRAAELPVNPDSLVADSQTKPHDRVEHIGQRIGPYQLLEEIGSGGMGSVFLAQQHQPVKRRVALKVIKAGMDSQQVIARFEAERQALAIMDHPNIAKVFDGGLTELGRPYFVMEYVKGESITNYCDREKLSVKQRLNLFVTVCQAVQHAHQKGIIHRDLKPTNILVGYEDGKPVPKVIDFGLAKATHQSLTDMTLHTAKGMVLGTPLYMSPEQAESSPDIDTRTDVYSLGVILYELLTGSTPLEKQRMKQMALGEVVRAIREEDPPKPSSRITTSDFLPSIAAQRSVDPSHLKRRVAGDLDWVVMKALEKERGRRYETADGLASDILRHMQDEPVLAGPPSARYRMRKFVRRNRVAVAAASIVMLGLLIGISGTSWGLIQANLARAKESEAKQQVILQRDVANDSLDLAIDAIEQYFSGVARDTILKEPGLRDLRQRLLKQPNEFFQQLTKQIKSDTSPEGRERLANANQLLYKIQLEYGESSDAQESLETAIELAEALIAEDPTEPRYLSLALDLEYERAYLFGRRKDIRAGIFVPQEIQNNCRRAAQYAQTLSTLKPNDHVASLKALAANVQLLIFYGDKDDEFEVYLSRATTLAQNLKLDALPTDALQEHACDVFSSLAFPLLFMESDLATADEILSKVAEFLQLKPVGIVTGSLLAETIDRLVMVRKTLDPEYSSLEDRNRIYELRSSVLQFHPNNVGFKTAVARAALGLGKSHFENGDLIQSESYSAKASKLFKEIVQDHPNNFSAIVMLQMSERIRGEALMKLNRFSDAIAALESVADIDNYHGEALAGEIDARIIYAKAQLGKYDEVYQTVSRLANQVKPIHSIALAQAMEVCAANATDENENSKYRTKSIELIELALSQSYSKQDTEHVLDSLSHADFDSVRQLNKFQSLKSSFVDRFNNLGSPKSEIGKTQQPTSFGENAKND